MKAHYVHYPLHFKFPAGTSRGVLLHKPSWFLILENEGIEGVGECSIIPGLSVDSEESYTAKLDEVCLFLNNGGLPSDLDLSGFPSIAFGLETAILDLQNKGNKTLFASNFTAGQAGIPINGLVWMGDKTFMQKQIKEKIDAGYRCIKLKVGALDFETELDILSGIRKEFSPNDIELRLDANGGFTPTDALTKLHKLANFSIHSIEQPIKQGQMAEMAKLCNLSPIPIVLDEELIGILPNEELLRTIKPAYIILKPSLIGGFAVSETWIQLAKEQNIGWWITSALEANIGLNAIAQWTSTLESTLPQGLGTGQLYHNNIPSPLVIRDAKLFYDSTTSWDLSSLLI